MNKLYEVTSMLMEKNEVKNIELANFLGVSSQAFGNWVGRKTIPDKYAKKISEFFNTDLNYIYNPKTKPVKKVKIIGTASCGNPNTNHYQLNESVNYNGEFYKDNLYCVIANGDSMAPEIEDGDEVICDPDANIKNGDLVHYTVGDESAIKIYIRDDEAYIIQFVPYNQSKTFKTKTIRLDDDIDIKIAKVVAVNKLKFNNRLARLKLIGRA